MLLSLVFPACTRGSPEGSGGAGSLAEQGASAFFPAGAGAPISCAVGSLSVSPVQGSRPFPELEALLRRAGGSGEGDVHVDVAYLLAPVGAGTPSEGFSLGLELHLGVNGRGVHLADSAVFDLASREGAPVLDHPSGSRVLERVDSLLFRCTLEYGTDQAIAARSPDPASPQMLLAWARVCGDRRIGGCVPKLLRLLEDEAGRRPELAAAVIYGLGVSGDRELVLGPVLRRCGPAQTDLLRACLMAAGELGGPAAMLFIQTRGLGDPDPSIKELSRQLIEIDSRRPGK